MEGWIQKEEGACISKATLYWWNALKPAVGGYGGNILRVVRVRIWHAIATANANANWPCQYCLYIITPCWLFFNSTLVLTPYINNKKIRIVWPLNPSKGPTCMLYNIFCCNFFPSLLLRCFFCLTQNL